ncbi:MAG: hypothetical protein COW26_05975 [Nitrosopumilales archaeon CG15_BIG_FIL_POST_REV_8_21_14_020_33_23]|jgi:hypothetical protein|nr:MAG: hypothetical protein COV65_06950 [Nitrosopumilales archaeon CG11_big_fil_rev_8_21_14_0_20_33_24]PIW34724.1 MAG: hypothetical protein COW26_05975 [Nitrosopumilales archaeon CG15_BIG_FIL_POST_REV_8_21_14_020_33_23]PIY88858.1 MAG: hypothetical protein COY74_07310 [Nitrosopumilales archaeon CG_4_10_14_0_8_um_filter_34_8]PJB98248.1 MAG: hypothetical protein CO079_02935 [Nitrosopumilales archaeon CG_4_9_14_0_8_um_filter_34_10]
MKICSICHRISGTEQDHLDCIQKIRIENEDENFKQSIPEKLELTKNSQNLGIEIKAILEHLTKENKKDD